MAEPFTEAEFRVPQSEGSVLAALEACVTVTETEYGGNLVRMRVAGPRWLLGRFVRFRLRAEASAR